MQYTGADDMKPLKRIMHVDDDEDIQVITKMSLGLVGGFELYQFSSGADAVRQVGSVNPDLIILDAVMPEMDGSETIRRIRKIKRFTSTPVIFMTAKVDSNVLQDLMDQGALSVVTKPFDPLKLASQIQNIWDSL